MDISRWAFQPDLPQWPLDAEGNKVGARLLRHTVDAGSEAELTVSLLAAYGIPCFPYYGGEGMTGKVINGFSGFGTTLYVPESLHDEAAALLAAEIVENEEE